MLTVTLTVHGTLLVTFPGDMAVTPGLQDPACWRLDPLGGSPPLRIWKIGRELRRTGVSRRWRPSTSGSTNSSTYRGRSTGRTSPAGPARLSSRPIFQIPTGGEPSIGSRRQQAGSWSPDVTAMSPGKVTRSVPWKVKATVSMVTRR